MILSKKDLKFYMYEDAKRYDLTNRNKYLIKFLCRSRFAHSLHYLRILRHFEYYLNCSQTFLGKFLCSYYRFWHLHLSLKYGIEIGPNIVGYGLWILHYGGGIVINCKSMGNNCIVNFGTLVGVRDSNDKPIIGDNVELAAGCKVLGGIHIGNNVRIAPQAVVINDVPDNCIVGGIPAKIIKQNGIRINN